ncbi:restriction endonuclease [Longimicrobium sp.]|jgi:hypothetical protein|uniref:restriction endonuclease n=1 Tax=Longimicrobium sp. TaxID=2029185 RepID=UPI002F94214F
MSEPNPNSGWPELRQLWSDILNRRATAWPPGRALEQLVIRAFELDGAVIRRPFNVRLEGSPIEQLDGAVYAAGLHCIVECKDRREPLRADAIAKLRNQLLRRPAGTVGLLFSRSGYHEAAKVLARYSAQQPILLWHKEEIDAMLEREDPCAMLQLKYRKCVEEGKPESNLIEVGP